ncbi:hypothetical protein H5410_045914, partial [Solanum commersonii]
LLVGRTELPSLHCSMISFENDIAVMVLFSCQLVISMWGRGSFITLLHDIGRFDHLLVCLLRFDARRECNARKYFYLIPAEIIGIKNESTSSEIEYHIAVFHVL